METCSRGTKMAAIEYPKVRANHEQALWSHVLGGNKEALLLVHADEHRISK